MPQPEPCLRRLLCDLHKKNYSSVKFKLTKKIFDVGYGGMGWVRWGFGGSEWVMLCDGGLLWVYTGLLLLVKMMWVVVGLDVL